MGREPDKLLVNWPLFGYVCSKCSRERERLSVLDSSGKKNTNEVGEHGAAVWVERVNMERRDWQSC